MRYRLILLLILCTGALSAQEALTFKKVDAGTYQLYLDKDWTGLITLGEQAIGQGFDYHYLNLRIGIAYFETRQYFRAMEYFDRALEQNSSSEIARDYLYWCYRYTGHLFKSSLLFDKLPATTQEKYQKPYPRALDYFYTEGGYKISTIPDEQGHITYLSAGMGHYPLARLHIHHEFTHLRQEQFWGSYAQNQYYISPQWYAGKGFIIQPAFHILGLKGDLNLDFPIHSVRDTMVTVGNPPQQRGARFIVEGADKYRGELKQTGVLINLGFRKQWKRFYIHPYFSRLNYRFQQMANVESVHKLTLDIGNPPHPPIIIVRDTTFQHPEHADSTSTFTQIGISARYTPPIWQDRLQIGLAIHRQRYEQENYHAFVPELGLQLHQKIRILLKYYSGNGIFVAEENGAWIQNTLEPIPQKMTFLVDYQIKPGINIYGVYQRETRDDISQTSTYHFNSLFTGIKFRL